MAEVSLVHAPTRTRSYGLEFRGSDSIARIGYLGPTFFHIRSGENVDCVASVTRY
jgi:hypothetical protein